MQSLNIHKTAIVHSNAQIGQGVSVGPYSVLGPDVKIEDNVSIASHCVIEGKTSIGKNCKIYSGAVLGTVPQDKKFNGDTDVSLVIGEDNVIREYVTVNLGTADGGGETVIGNSNLLMAYSHVAHDCVLGNNCVLANSVAMAGHVTLEDNAVVGGLTGIHQFVRQGRLSIVGGLSRVNQDIPPFSMCVGYPAKVYNLNFVGLRRSSIPTETVNILKKAFKILFHSELSKSHALEKVENEIPPCPELEHLIFFIKTSKRGLCS